MMRRRIFTSLTLISLFLSALLTLLWVESYFSSAGVWLAASRSFVVRHPITQSQSIWCVRWCLSWEHGWLALTRRVDCVFAPQARILEFAPPPAALPPLPGTGPPARSTFPVVSFDGSIITRALERRYDFAGDSFIHEEPLFVRSAAVSVGARAGSTELHVGFWQLVLLTGMMPLAWLLGRLRRWRAALGPLPGCCRFCGYDLRGTPDRCPECGAHSGRVILRGKRLGVSYS